MTAIELPDEQTAAVKAKAVVGAPARPRKRSRYTLSQLMNQCDLSVPLSDEDRAWLNAPSVGHEF